MADNETTEPASTVTRTSVAAAAGAGIGATAYSCGVALTASLADGDVIEVMLATPVVAGPTN